MQIKKKNIIIIIQLLLIGVQMAFAILFDNIHVRTMAEGAHIIVVRHNFLSQMMWGNGNYFPILFVGTLLAASFILLLELIKNDDKEAKLSLNIIIIGGILFLIIPLLIGMELMNLGLAAMVVIELIILLLNLLKSNI